MLTIEEKIDSLFMLSICKLHYNTGLPIAHINYLLEELFRIIYKEYIWKTQLPYINFLWKELKKNMIKYSDLKLKYYSADYDNIENIASCIDKKNNIDFWEWKHQFIYYFNKLCDDIILK